MKSLLGVAATAALALMLHACGDDETRVPPQEVDGNVTPTMVTDSVNSLVSDSGITRYHLVAPVWQMFDQADEPYWRFPEGMELERYDDSMQVTATVVCDSAIYLTGRKVWRLDGNVRMRNLQGDVFLTNQVWWNQKSHTVHNDTFIHIRRADRIIEGYGFTSNEQMTNYTVRRPSGIFPTPQRRDSLPR